MPKRNVLIVEDDDSIRRLLTATLSLQPALTIDVARDGAEALHRIRQRHYSVILLDLLMPHMSGIDVLDSLCTLSSPTPEIGQPRPVPRIIVITGATGTEIPDGQIKGRFPSAVARIFRKPLDLPALVQQIETMLGGPRAQG